MKLLFVLMFVSVSLVGCSDSDAINCNDCIVSFDCRGEDYSCFGFVDWYSDCDDSRCSVLLKLPDRAIYDESLDVLLMDKAGDLFMLGDITQIDNHLSIELAERDLIEDVRQGFILSFGLCE